MEQTQYWIWTRTRYSSSRPHLSTQIPRIFVGSSYNESWEEKAFAKDTAGHIGGCIWPPRSYSCGFCRREFRSTQALGGHMNVHRRDRARLKQSLSRSEETTEDQQHPNPCMVMAGTRYQRQVSPLVNGAAANPNPNYCVPAASVTPRISASFTGENWPEKNLFSPSFSSSSSTARENLKGSVFATTRSQEDYTPLRLVIIPESKLEGENLLSREFGLQRWGDPGGYNEETNYCNKRRRTDPTPAFFIRASSGDQQQVQPQVLNCNPVEELDLELRLGDAPKIK